MGWGGCYELESFLISNPRIIYSVGCCGWGEVISGVTSEEEVVLSCIQSYLLHEGQHFGYSFILSHSCPHKSHLHSANTFDLSFLIILILFNININI